MQLSQKQLQIVNHKDGALLVEVSPGSGKTRVLIERIKSLLSSSKRGKVLALTFSNLAADEMKARLSEDRSFEEQIDRVIAGTIHFLFGFGPVSRKFNRVKFRNGFI